MKTPRDCSGADLIRALQKLGYEKRRQSGSHIQITTQQNGEHHVTVPNHRPLKTGMLHGILKEVARHHGMTVEQVLLLLEV